MSAGSHLAPLAETPGGRALALRGLEPAARSAPQLLVQLARAPGARLRAELAAAGLHELGYLANNTLLLERGRGSVDALERLGDVLGVSPYLAGDRVSRELSREALEARDAQSRTGDQVPLLVHVLPGHDWRDVQSAISARGLSVLGGGAAGRFSRVSTLVPRQQAAALAEELAELPSVFFVERVHHLGFFNERSAGSIQSGAQGTSAMVTPIWTRGLRGEGQIVGLIDSGLDVDSCFFADSVAGKLPRTNTWSRDGGYGKEVDASHRKLIAYDFLYSCDQWSAGPGCEMPSAPGLWDNHGHGTHCAGSMVGSRTGGRNNGMAPAAKLVVQDGGSSRNSCSEMPGLGCPVIDLYPIFEQAYAQGARVHNNSYGDNEEAPAPNQSNYTARSQDVDRFVWDHKDMLIVFAVGNGGGGNRDFSVGSPSTNKNGLAVGSARVSASASSDDDLSSFSSRGWTADGRVKPDIVAPGCTVSAGNDARIDSNNCSEDTGCGTSYAAPIAAGAAALARQYFSEGFYPSGERRAQDARTPTAALLKAVLLNGAVAMMGRDNTGQAISPIPSNEQGWGRIQLDRSLLFAGATRKLFVDDHAAGFEAGSNQSVRYELEGVSADEPLKVTLVWTDYPGMPDSPPRMPSVSNVAALNAPRLVNDLDLSVEAGGQLYLGNVLSNGRSSAGGQPDRRNNVEQVIVDASGDVSLIVQATNVAQQRQDYALVVTGRWQRIGLAGSVDEASGIDASTFSPPALAGDAGRSDSGAVTQSVNDPVLAGSTGDAGAGAAAPQAPGAVPGPDATPSQGAEAGGCECRTNAHAASDHSLAWLALLLWAWRARRR